MATNWSFGQVILSALENQKARQMESERLAEQQRQFDLNHGLNTKQLNAQEKQFQLNYDLAKERWLEGEKKEIEQRIKSMGASDEAKKTELEIQLKDLENNLTMHRERMLREDRGLDIREKLGMGELQLGKDQLGLEGRKVDLSERMFNKEGKTMINPTTGVPFMLYNSGEIGGDLPLGEWSQYRDDIENNVTMNDKKKGEPFNLTGGYRKIALSSYLDQLPPPLDEAIGNMNPQSVQTYVQNINQKLYGSGGKLQGSGMYIPINGKIQELGNELMFPEAKTPPLWFGKWNSPLDTLFNNQRRIK